ncbi:hypothetical protein [Leptolyngbya sp. FACHB-16]|nr:hypothetical protein [Leptolyngbya sp. FACHB-16]MBD1910975.1 hypothetical protein [Leptolyngbya sp. FACHB-8]MBD2158358.1 hypothetical protein [Leptolyngbya sp. FACHB-16]
MKLIGDISKGFGKGAIALILSAGLLTACQTNTQTSVEEPESTSPNPAVEHPISTTGDQSVRTGELTGNIEKYMGETLSIRGEMRESVGDIAFSMAGDRLFDGKDVLVINATGTPFLVPDGNQFTKNLQVIGQVRRLATADLQKEYGLNLDPQTYQQYEDSSVVIAQSIAFAPEPEEISKNPESYYGQTISVEGTVADQLTPSTFTLQDNDLFAGEEVLVIGSTPDAALAEKEDIVITGVLRPYIPNEFEQDYDLDWDSGLKQKIDDEFIEKPVLVVESIFPAAK